MVFVHVTKTAGVSIEALYGQQRHDHRTALDYEMILGKKRYKEFFSFTVVRNPWDKMVSQYCYNAFNWVPRGTSFSGYLKAFKEGQQVTRFSPFHLPYISNKRGDIMVDYIGRFEALDEVMLKLSQELNIPYQSIPHKNKSSRESDYRGYYDEETRQIIADMFAEEIALFGYKF